MAALHAVRPPARDGAVLVAGAFGLVHGRAFAGILTDLGLGGSTSLLALLAFDVGVELAQLVTVALLVPSLHLASRTRWYGALRSAAATVALAAALGWALDRLGVLADPLAGLEDAAIGHPWWVVAWLAAPVVGCRLLDRRPATPPPGRRTSPAGGRPGRPGRAQLAAPAGRPVRGRARAAPSPAASTAVVTAKAAW